MAAVHARQEVLAQRRRVQHGVDQQRVAAGQAVHLGSASAGQEFRLGEVEGTDAHAVAVAFADGRCRAVGFGQHEQDAGAGHAPRCVEEAVQGRRVGVLDVVDRDEQGARGGSQLGRQVVELDRIQRDRAGRHGQQLGQHAQRQTLFGRGAGGVQPAHSGG